MAAIPVDNDPFATSSARPSRLTPVDHDPFASAAPDGTAVGGAPASAGGLGSTIANIMNFSPLGQTNAAPAGSDLGTTALWNKPANVSWTAYMLAHAAKPLQQADDLVRGATNTFGLGDRFAAGMSDLTGIGGGDLAAQRETSTARAQADPLYGVGQTLGYAPVGAAGVGAKLGGGVLGAMGEGALAGLGGALGNNTADTWGGTAENALIGTAVGGAAGVPAGLLSKALTPGPFSSAVAKQRADITAGAEAAKDSAYTALSDPKYHASELLPELDQIKTDLYSADTDNALPQAAPRAMKVYNTLVRQTQAAPSQTQSAGAIQDAIKAFKKIQGGPPGMEVDVASHFRDGLEGLIGTADGAAGPGAVGSLTPVTNHTPEQVQGMLTAASKAQQAYKNAEFLQESGQNLKAWGASPAAQAEAIAKKYYPSQAAPFAINPNDPAAAQYGAFANINKAAGGGGITPYGVVHAARPVIEAAAGGLGAGVGGPAGAVVGDALGGAIDYGLVKPLATKGLGWRTASRTQNAINQQYPALVPGTTVAPPPSDVARALQSLLFGNLAARGL